MTPLLPSTFDPARFRESWEFSNCDVPGLSVDGYRIGKAFMLSRVPSWYGVKYLDDEVYSSVLRLRGGRPSRSCLIGSRVRPDSLRYPEAREVAGCIMKWIGVEERLPQPSQRVLFVANFDGRPVICFGFYDGSGAEWTDITNYDRDGNYVKVYTTTYWMALPALPDAECH
jgi:hypothetical protein